MVLVLSGRILPPINLSSLPNSPPMKKIVVLTLFVFALACAGARAQGTSSIVLTSGSLAIKDGYLVQLLADTSGSFGDPTTTSFTGTTDPNEVVLDSFAMDDTTTSISGVFQKDITFNLGTGAGQIPAGTSLMLRWYPNILYSTYNPSTSVPGATNYGQFTTTSKEYASDPNPQTATAWTVPASGDYNYDVWFLTTNEDSNGPGAATNVPLNSAGLATLSTVPEPASISLIAGAIGLGAIAVRRRRK